MQLSQTTRPQSLSEIVGHKVTVAEFQKRFRERRIPQSLLFVGEPGCCKTSFAYIIAKHLTCENPDKDGNPCNKCEYCKDVIEEKFGLAVYSYDARELNVTLMQEIKDISMRHGIVNKTKVIFIDELQQLHHESTKLLYNLLERKVKNTYFILGAMDESKINGALLRRCQRYRLQPLSLADTGTALSRICEKHNIVLDNEKKKMLVALAQRNEGRLGGAVADLERVLESEIWDADTLSKELGISSNSQIEKITQALLTGKATDVFATEITDHILKDIRYTLILATKHRLGVKLKMWEMERIKGLEASVPLKRIIFSLQKINELTKYPFLDRVTIETTIAEILMASGDLKI